MAWVKIPKEHHPLFVEALPQDPAVNAVRMFGAVAALVNGNMFGGLFARSAIVKVDAADQREVLAMDGGAPFDPMGNGRTMKDTVVLPESVMADSNELRRWLARALAYTRTLPPKKKTKKPSKQRATPETATKGPAKKAPKNAAKKKAVKKKAAKKSAAKPRPSKR